MSFSYLIMGARESGGAGYSSAAMALARVSRVDFRRGAFKISSSMLDGLASSVSLSTVVCD